MLRFALAYQGGGGGNTYITGGNEIDVSFRPAIIDIASGNALDITTGDINFDVVSAGKALDIEYGGTGIDL